VKRSSLLFEGAKRDARLVHQQLDDTEPLARGEGDPADVHALIGEDLGDRDIWPNLFRRTRR